MGKAEDTTGYSAARQAQTEFNTKYTAIPRSQVVQVINDVGSGMSRMMVALVPYIGMPAYFTAMAGNTAEEIAIQYPDLDTASFATYVGAQPKSSRLKWYLAVARSVKVL